MGHGKMGVIANVQVLGLVGHHTSEIRSLKRKIHDFEFLTPASALDKLEIDRIGPVRLSIHVQCDVTS